MNKFKPLTGGHPVENDDFMLMQDSFLDGFKALVLSTFPSGSGILDGCQITVDVANVTCTTGFIAIAGEIYSVSSTSFPKSSNPADFLWFNIIEGILAPSPVTYEDKGVKNVHLQRTAVLKYKVPADTSGQYLLAMLSADYGEIRDWVVPTNFGTILDDFFDTTGLGINSKRGWAICNGLNGTPDLRGFYTAQATVVPNSGASPLSASLNGIIVFPGDTGGANKITLVQANLPNITLPVFDAGHSHGADNSDPAVLFVKRKPGGPGAGLGLNNVAGFESASANTKTSTTGITVGTGGADAGAENRPPTYYCYKIIKIR